MTTVVFDFETYDVNSYYPSGMFSYKPKPRQLSLEILEPPHKCRYSVRVNYGNWWDDKIVMEEWCSKQYGARSAKYNNPRWHRNDFDFRFKNKGDATMFILKWS